jgi:hypothetical protein
MRASKSSYAVGLLLSLLIAWVIAGWWSMLSSDPWCLYCFPKWLDKQIYSIASPFLSYDMGTAAEQMDFIEVFIATFIMASVVLIPLIPIAKENLFEGPEIVEKIESVGEERNTPRN